MDLKKYLIDKKEDINNLNIKPRLIDFPATNLIISIIGPRRAGKTYSLYDFIINKKGLKESEYIFINFEDEAIQSAERDKLLNLISFHEEIYGKEPKYIFLDEIQAMDKWERFVYTLFERKKYKIFITGSSSKLLSKEIATELRGRSATFAVFPFSFKEMLLINKIEIKKFYSTREENKIKNLLLNYLKTGGFPDIALSEIDAKRFFKDYIDLIVFKDLVERFNIRNIFLMKFILNNALNSFAKEFSIHKLYLTLKSQNIKASKKTLYSYISLLEDTMFSFSLNKFSFSLKDSMLTIPKIYINDSGLVNAALMFNLNENTGRLMENLVFLEFKRKINKNPSLEIYYWKDLNSEVDFVVKEGSDVKQLIQVCYSLEDEKTGKREIKGLLKASDELKCDDLLLISYEDEKDIKIKDKTIKVVTLWKWLLS